ncbi:T9SS type A sorting domain-containing protein, partial [Salegentibacter flavus]
RSDNDSDSDEGCYSIASFDVTVYDNPDLVVTDLEDCEDGITGYQSFDLNDGVTTVDGNVTFYPTENDAINETNALTAAQALDVDVPLAGATYWVRSENTEDDSCYTIDSFDITVYDNPDITTTNPEFICVGDSIDLSMYVSNPDGGVLTYHTSMNDADTDMGALMNSVVTPELGETTYWVRSEITNGDYVCYSIDSITVTVETCIIDQGCTLGYWKNHTDRWCENTYTIGGEEVVIATCTPYGDVFVDAPTNGPIDIASLTLYEAISLEGNSNGENLARQSVAALLNACSSEVGYVYYNVYTLIDDVNEAWRGNPKTENSFAMELDYMNNSYCPLGGTSATTEPSDSCINGVEATSEESSFRTMTADLETADFSVYPLPFTSSLSVRYEFEYTSNVTLEFYNITGQLLRTYKDKRVTNGDVTELTLDFATKANQIYILRVITDRDVFFKKILSGN